MLIFACKNEVFIMEFQQVLNQRFSVREFEQKMVEDEKINEMLKAAQLAPTAKKQPATKNLRS